MPLYWGGACLILIVPCLAATGHLFRSSLVQVDGNWYYLSTLIFLDTVHQQWLCGYVSNLNGVPKNKKKNQWFGNPNLGTLWNAWFVEGFLVHLRWSPYSRTAPLSWSWDLTNVGPNKKLSFSPGDLRVEGSREFNSPVSVRPFLLAWFQQCLSLTNWGGLIYIYI